MIAGVKVTVAELRGMEVAVAEPRYVFVAWIFHLEGAGVEWAVNWTSQNIHVNMLELSLGRGNMNLWGGGGNIP